MKTNLNICSNPHGQSEDFSPHWQHGFRGFYWCSVVYILMCIIAISIYVMQRLRFPIPAVINNYFNDFLCMPIVIGALTVLMRKLKKDSSFRFSIWFILFLAGYYSVYFEFYLPGLNPRYTGDIFDVFLYFAGGLFYFLCNRELKKRQNYLFIK